ncbi:hypothetical protein [Azospirillum canadense]|uniref:hypothetical protein n=1 Tax=Azospirillum canadense TaxID=403962 RepID=UPI002226521D|nr:hypothetical protein [Azospirillum canadense]MCW2240694.1 hypothetical protein [Azospirillum canadense]
MERDICKVLENWVIDRIANGEIADLKDFDAEVGELDPRRPQLWGARRKLKSGFIIELLTHKSNMLLCSARGVRIVGALIDGPLKVTYGRLEAPLWLDACRFTGPIDFEGLQSERRLSLRNSAVLESVNLRGAAFGNDLLLDGIFIKDTLDMTGLRVARSLFLNSTKSHRAAFTHICLDGADITGNLFLQGALVTGILSMEGISVGRSLDMKATQTKRSVFNKIALNGAKIGENVFMTGAGVTGSLTLDGLHAGKSVWMQSEGSYRSTFKDVSIKGAEIKDNIFLDDAVIDGQLNMMGLRLGESLFMRSIKSSVREDPSATFESVNLQASVIKGEFHLNGAQIKGILDAKGMQVGKNMSIRNAAVKDPIPANGINIGGSLDLSGASLSGLNIAGGRIGSEILLGSSTQSPLIWSDDAELVLSNTSAGALLDRGNSVCSAIGNTPDTWPAQGKLKLGGFSYGRLGSTDRDAGSAILNRSSNWFTNWLARDSTYAPQSYVQLANALRAAGEPDKANWVLYAGRERARKETYHSRWREPNLRWWGLSLLKWSIGYGIGLRYFRSLGWVAVLAVIGAIILWYFKQPPCGGPSRIFYSLDQLLPIVQLDDWKEERARQISCVRYVFYCYNFIGIAIGSFIVAGLSGLTQK